MMLICLLRICLQHHITNMQKFIAEKVIESKVREAVGVQYFTIQKVIELIGKKYTE